MTSSKPTNVIIDSLCSESGRKILLKHCLAVLLAMREVSPRVRRQDALAKHVLEFAMGTTVDHRDREILDRSFSTDDVDEAAAALRAAFGGERDQMASMATFVRGYTFAALVSDSMKRSGEFLREKVGGKAFEVTAGHVRAALGHPDLEIRYKILPKAIDDIIGFTLVRFKRAVLRAGLDMEEQSRKMAEALFPKSAFDPSTPEGRHFFLRKALSQGMSPLEMSRAIAANRHDIPEDHCLTNEEHVALAFPDESPEKKVGPKDGQASPFLSEEKTEVSKSVAKKWSPSTRFFESWFERYGFSEVKAIDLIDLARRDGLNKDGLNKDSLNKGGLSKGDIRMAISIGKIFIPLIKNEVKVFQHLKIVTTRPSKNHNRIYALAKPFQKSPYGNS
jgi:hypothetical protein